MCDHQDSDGWEQSDDVVEAIEDYFYYTGELDDEDAVLSQCGACSGDSDAARKCQRENNRGGWQ